jgi:hypothetical protein
MYGKYVVLSALYKKLLGTLAGYIFPVVGGKKR